MPKLEMMTKKITFAQNQYVAVICGDLNRNLQDIEQALHIRVHQLGNHLELVGAEEAVQLAHDFLQDLYRRAEKGDNITLEEMKQELRLLRTQTAPKPAIHGHMGQIIQTRKHPIKPRTQNQANYIDALQKHDLTFGLGPAGTGKTYLAVAVAVSHFLAGKVKKIILTRPAVEAGENLGFLPGDLKEKVDPYLRPLFDALNDMLPPDVFEKMMQAEQIEVAPLAFMRGRTLSYAFVILDEAQNTTAMQMKMFLTRLGEGSKMVVNGDVSQIDLPSKVVSGLVQAKEYLSDIPDIGFVEFSDDDVVRHPLVSKIIKAYNKAGNSFSC